ncbi:MAG TPA: hypothetical protein VKR58_13215 [Aquella sp.]|nr:hypothetical protein [Aquella sp.]
MKFKYLTAICALVSSFSYADVCSLSVGAKKGDTFNGPTSCSTGSMGSFGVNGPLQIDGTKITGKLTINGPLTANKANVNNLVIKGPTTATDSQFKTINAHGPVILTDSKVDSILMPGPDHLDLEKICLNGKTMVKNITVKSGKGVIYKQIEAKISGKVSGAVVKPYAADEC